MSQYSWLYSLLLQ